jgi:hypothetical protein
LNMLFMAVTLEVSKLSGWLNAFAFCRVEGRGTCDAGARCGPRGRRACGGGGAIKRHARGRPDSRLLGARARAERTRNMLAMFVTMEVSRLSGWLKACAPENILYMVVTLEVSQLEMSALKFVKSLKR